MGLAGAAAIAAVIWITVVAEGFAAPDESWFLQVVARIQTGQTLYRDVHFNVTPLSVYVTLGLTSIFPTELLLVRSLVAAALVLTVAMCWMLCRVLGVGRLAPWLLVCAWTQPTPYTPLAVAFFAAAFYATTLWMRDVHEYAAATDNRNLAFAAVSAGLCFGAKQNLGLLCLGAVLLSILIVAGRKAPVFRHALVVLGGFLLTAMAIMLPVFVSGALDRFVVYGFGKTVYVQTGGVPYSAPIERFLTAVSDVSSVDALAAAYRECAFLLPPVVFMLLGAACLRARSLERQTALVVTTFVAAGYLVVFPGPGGSAIMFAIPILVVGLAFGWSRARDLVSRRWAFTIQAAITVLFFGQIGLRFVRHTNALLSTEYVTSDIPHFRGIKVPEATHTRVHAEAGLLSSLAAGQPMFLIGPNAGFYYLAANLRNPGAFDFPYVSVFGRAGQGEVIARILADDIRSVFVFSGPIDRQTPRVLHEFVRTSMVRVRDEPLGVLYRGRRNAGGEALFGVDDRVRTRDVRSHRGKR